MQSVYVHSLLIWAIIILNLGKISLVNFIQGLPHACGKKNLLLFKTGYYISASLPAFLFLYLDATYALFIMFFSAP